MRSSFALVYFDAPFVVPVNHYVEVKL